MCWYVYILSHVTTQLVKQHGLCLVDIDECSVGTAVCEQNCTNIPGSYVCGCGEGYYESGFNCIGIS